MRTARLVLATLTLGVALLPGAFGCAWSGDDSEDAGACNPDCVNECHGSCTTAGDSEGYDECMEGCSCGCD